MASTFSPNLRLELIGTGEQQGTWGATTNVNLGTLLEEAIGGYTSVTVSDAGDTTLTTNNGSADQSRNMVLNLTGTISAARNVICPAIEKLYVVKNATTGGYAVTIKVSGQTGVSVPNGSTVFVYVDGTDVRAITGSAALQSIGTSGATVPLLNGTNTWSSSQTFSASVNTFGSNSNPTSIYVSGGTSTNKGVFFQTTGLNRWSVFSNSVAESGAGAGSNFGIGRYDDSGAAVDSPLIINRATGVTTIAQLALTTPLAIAQGGTGATSNSTARTNLGAAASGANTDLTSVYLNNTGLKVKDTDASHGLSIVPGSNLSADRVFTLTTGDASRTLDISASNVTISSAGAALIDDADASAQRTTLGLGTISTQNSNNVSITGGAISGVTISGITDIAIADGGTGASDAATARTNLGIGTIATQDANSVSITGGSISGITDLALADGGTGASDAATARTNLGLGTIATQNANNVTITGGAISGITDLAIADGGTGASTAASARTNLGLGTLATLSAVGTAQITDANVTAAKLSGAQTGAAPIYGVRAWVVFDGTVASPTITASGNVTSVTKNGTGDYTINFTTALPNANYAVSVTGYAGSGTGITGCVSSGTAPTTGAVRVQLSYYGYPASTASAFATDSSRVSVMVLA